MSTVNFFINISDVKILIVVTLETVNPFGFPREPRVQVERR
jgi:hypothetical protein